MTDSTTTPTTLATTLAQVLADRRKRHTTCPVCGAADKLSVAVLTTATLCCLACHADEDVILAAAGLDRRYLARPSAALADADAVFRTWFGPEYDLDALHAALAATAVERLDGDPIWLLLISGPGNAKTETLAAFAGAGAIVTSSISSPAALLSGTAAKEKAADATGGLMRRLGPRGVLVIKDVTSILTMNRDLRGAVLAGLREVYDGRWERNLGTDGGRSLLWTGRIALLGAVTSAWDSKHAVIAAMGDRFALVRIDSHLGRRASGRSAIQNTGHETVMRAELATAVGAVLAAADLTKPIPMSDDDTERILVAADLVTLARTVVEYDYHGHPIDSHAPEAPTRFAKQLAQIIRGGRAIGLSHAEARRLAIRVARDSTPPMRLAILDDVAKHPATTVTDAARRLGKPRASVDRQMLGMLLLGLLKLDADEPQKPYVTGSMKEKGDKSAWRFSLVSGIHPSVLKIPKGSKATRSPRTPEMSVMGDMRVKRESAATDFSGVPGDDDGDGDEVTDDTTL